MRPSYLQALDKMQQRVKLISISPLIAVAEHGLHLLHITANCSGKKIKSRFPQSKYTRIIFCISIP